MSSNPVSQMKAVDVENPHTPTGTDDIHSQTGVGNQPQTSHEGATSSSEPNSQPPVTLNGGQNGIARPTILTPSTSTSSDVTSKDPIVIPHGKVEDINPDRNNDNINNNVNRISSRSTKFPAKILDLRAQADTTWRPFWPIISTLLVCLDITISLAIIILSAVTATFAGESREVVRGLAITSTVLAGSAALMKGTGLPLSAYHCERALFRFNEQVVRLQRDCDLCVEPVRSRRFGGWFASRINAMAADDDKERWEAADVHTIHQKGFQALEDEWLLLTQQMEGVGTEAFSAFGWGSEKPKDAAKDGTAKTAQP